MPYSTGAPWNLSAPLATDPPDGPNQIKASVDTVHPVLGNAWPCTSGTRPAHAAGRLIWETDTIAYYISDGTSWQPVPIGGGWASYTPVISGYTTVTTAKSGRYRRVGLHVHGWAAWNVTAVTTLGSGTITVTLPPHPVSSNYPATAARMGNVEYRTNAGVYVSGMAEAVAGASTFTILVQLPAGTNPNHLRLTGNGPAGQVVGDQWFADFSYETA